MKALLTAGLCTLVLQAAAGAQTATLNQCTQTIQTQPAVVETQVAPIPVVRRHFGWFHSSAPVCTSTTGALQVAATYPGQAVEVVAPLVPRAAGGYLAPNADYSQDFIWEPFGPESDLMISGG